MAINKKKSRGGKTVWQVDWSLPLGNGKYKRAREQFDTEYEAKAFEASGYVREQTGYSFMEKAKEFLDVACLGVTKPTLKRRTGILKKFNNFCVTRFQVGSLNAIKAPMISAYMKSEKARGLKNTTVNYDVKVIRNVFTYCVEMEYLDSSPGDKVKLLPDDTEKRKSWSKEQVETFLSRVKDDNLRDVFSFLYLTGTRPVMACRLKWKDVDFKNETITLHHYKGDGSLREQEFPLAGELLELLKCRFECSKKKFWHGPQIPVFPNKWGKERHPSSVGNLATNHLNKLRLEDESFNELELYGLRNTFINSMIRAKIQLDYVKELVGHKKLSTTEKYITSDNEDIKKAYLDFRSR